MLIPQLLLAGAGCVGEEEKGTSGDQGGADEANPPPDDQSHVASQWSAAVTGVQRWRMSSPQDGRAQFVGVDSGGGEVLRGTATAEVTKDDEQWWTFELEKPYAAKARYRESDLAPQPSGDARADVIFEAFTRDIFLGETTLQPSNAENRASIVDYDLAPVPRLPAGSHISNARNGLQCLTSFMLASYATSPAAKICRLNLETGYSNEYVRLYSGVDPADATHPYPTRRLVVAFAGSHRASDWLRNLASQFTPSVTHNNPLDGSAAISGGRVGRGWVDRWVNQANLQHRSPSGVPLGSLASRLKEHIRVAKLNNQRVVTYVVGHSLGAATADTAGYDIADWQSKEANLRQEVVVASYDAPRFGQLGARTTYQDTIKDRCSGPTVGKRCITRWGLSRTLDPVQSIPIGMDQIVWQTSTTDPTRRKMGLDSNANTILPFCPQFNAPVIDRINLVNNHYQTNWPTDISTNLTDAHLGCMFGRLVPEELWTCTCGPGYCGNCGIGGNPGTSYSSLTSTGTKSFVCGGCSGTSNPWDLSHGWVCTGSLGHVRNDAWSTATTCR